nr:carboxypeptidase Q-like [Leptinotarsa decemlineata]
MIMIGKLAVLLVVFFVLTIASSDVLDNEVNGCNLPTELKSEIASYGPTVNRIIDALTNGKFKGGVYNDLANFVDKFGARLSGTKNLENSIDYMLDLMKNRSLENVHGEHAMIPHWQRGDESGELLEPRKAKIGVLSLGSSVGTPSGSIQAEVLVVRSFEELEQANFSQAAKGNDNIFPFLMPPCYFCNNRCLENYFTKSLSCEGIKFFHRFLFCIHRNVYSITNLFIFQDRGQKIVIKLKTHTHSHPDSPSRNVVGEIVGSAKPEKILCTNCRILRKNSIPLKDFISAFRSVLWTAEEPGLIGAQAYNKAHASELKDHIFVMESDEGTFTPLGIEYNAGPKGGCIIQEILKLLSSINTTQSSYADAVGSDITIWAGQIPGGSLLNANDKYFYYHHSAADTMDVLDPDSLDKATALWASVAFIIADLKDEFPRDFKKDTLNDSVLLKKLKNSSQQRPRSPL